ncbi:MAG TPA: type II secretion system F family protein [Polyangiaceae bacterium]|nr:type II secretion system F family protein [Polyangiaceae bacterium]
MTTFLIGRAAWLVFVLLIAGIVGVEFGSERAPLRSRWTRYQAFWHQELTKLHASWSARKVLSVHLVAALAFLAMVMLGLWVYAAVCLVLVFSPNLWLWRARSKRTERLEEQLDAWLTALTNSLQANPSLGDAIASTIPLMDPPMRDEVELVIKENALGMPLDDALERAAVRSGSRVFRAAITTLKIARNTGGNLPQTLKTASETLREMARLEGVVRTKTADGRAQAVAIALLPAPVYFGIEYMMPGYYDPMRNSLVGHVIFAAVGVLWAGAALLSHKILAVDI